MRLNLGHYLVDVLTGLEHFVPQVDRALSLGGLS
jgi:hypothetical protein